MLALGKVIAERVAALGGIVIELNNADRRFIYYDAEIVIIP